MFHYFFKHVLAASFGKNNPSTISLGKWVTFILSVVLNPFGGCWTTLFAVQFRGWITATFVLLSQSLGRSCSEGKSGASHKMHHNGHDTPNLSTLFVSYSGGALWHVPLWTSHWSPQMLSHQDCWEVVPEIVKAHEYEILLSEFSGDKGEPSQSGDEIDEGTWGLNFVAN